MRLLRFTPFATDDWKWLYERLAGYVDAFAGGQLPPRSFPLAFGGAGYAFPHFYPPLSQWVGAGFTALTGSPVQGAHLAFLAAVTAAGMFMFLLGRRLGGSDRVGFVAGFTYAALPYLVANVFVRGALAETWALAWFPAVLLAALRGLDAGRPSPALAFAVAALILSHTVISMYFAVGCAVGLGLIWRTRGLVAALLTLASAGAGVALALWYLLPVWNGLALVGAGDAVTMLATEAQVRASAWLKDAVLLCVLPWLLVAIPLIWSRSIGSRWAFRALAAAGVFTVYAFWPGAFQPFLPAQLAYIQFSWRVLGIAGFLIVTALALMLGSRSLRLQFLVAGVALAAALPLALGTGSRLEPPAFRAAGMFTYTVKGEYLPRGVTLNAAARAAPRLEGFEISAERDGMMVTPTRPAARATAVLPLYYYPFYRAATASGSPVEVQNAAGYVAVRLGAEPVRIRVRNPPSFWWGLGIGCAALLLLAGWRYALRPDITLAQRRVMAEQQPSSLARRAPEPGAGSREPAHW